MKLQPILIRSHLVKAVRHFFDDQGFEEIITPVFQTGLPTEPNIYGFNTTWKVVTDEKKLYLAVSPESSLKKMLAAGIPKCYAISKCFRNLENSGQRHNPEFLMLEWYRSNSDYIQIMNDVQQLILAVKESLDAYGQRPFSPQLFYQGMMLDLESDWPRLSLPELFKKYAFLDIATIDDELSLIKAAQSKGYTTNAATWEQLFDQIFLNEIEPRLPLTPFFLVDFPARLSPLCKTQATQPYLADRFELYIAGMEIANGNNEQLNARFVKSAFEQETGIRQSQGKQVPPIDEEFIEALEKLEKQGQPLAGIGVGLDRLAMLMANVTNISEVEPFTLQPT